MNSLEIKVFDSYQQHVFYIPQSLLKEFDHHKFINNSELILDKHESYLSFIEYFKNFCSKNNKLRISDKKDFEKYSISQKLNKIIMI
jgi:hypothetical protein